MSLLSRIMISTYNEQPYLKQLSRAIDSQSRVIMEVGMEEARWIELSWRDC